MKKQFFRVKQLADQTFSRAEKSDVLTEEMVAAEKRVELIRQACQNTTKKIAACLQGIGLDHATLEKRQKKMPEVLLSQSMLEASNALGESSALAAILDEGGKLQGNLGRQLFNYEMEVERAVLGPLQAVLDYDIPNIAKLRKQLSKLTLDMDSARARFQTANRHSQISVSGSLSNNKADMLREEFEDAQMKVEHCRDSLSSEMYALLSRETELTQYIMQLFKLQAMYHRNALESLENCIPSIQSTIDNYKVRPVFGIPLDDHLSLTNRQIASVLEMCITSLYQFGMDEEGLFRIAGSASKIKKLKSGFDAGVTDLSEFESDPHTVAGALKSYLRELPEPLMCHSLYNDWMKASKISNCEKRLQELWQVLQQLPQSCYNNLRYLIKFLHELTHHSDLNKMSAQNLAIVIPPNIIWGPSDDGNMGMNMTVASTHSAIVDSLVTYADWFFPGTIDFSTSSIPKKRSNSYVPYNDQQIIHESILENEEQSEFQTTTTEEDSVEIVKESSPEGTLLSESIHFSSSESNSVVTTTTVMESLPLAKTQMADSPRVPKRLNKKAAPPIPKDAPTSPFLKSSSLDRSLSTRPVAASRVSIERAKSYIEKPVTKPNVKKSESISSETNDNLSFTFESGSEELLINLGGKSPQSTLERLKSQPEELDIKKTNENSHSPSSPSDRHSMERPTERPPLPPDRSKIGPSVIQSSIDSLEDMPVENSSTLSISVNEPLKPDENEVENRPERPPRSHSPNVTVMSEKQFCTVIQVQGQNDGGIKVKPAKPPLPNIKPRTSSSSSMSERKPEGCSS